MTRLPRCENPGIDDYPPWLLRAVKLALGRNFDDVELTDAREILVAIDDALAAWHNNEQN